MCAATSLVAESKFSEEVIRDLILRDWNAIQKSRGQASRGTSAVGQVHQRRL